MKKEIVQRQTEKKTLGEDCEATKRQIKTDKVEYEKLTEELDKFKVIYFVAVVKLVSFGVYKVELNAGYDITQNEILPLYLSLSVLSLYVLMTFGPFTHVDLI